MPANRGLAVRNLNNIGTTPKEMRLALAGLVAENAPGVPRSGLLNQSAANVVIPKNDMSYDVKACSPVIARAQDEGVYMPTMTGTTNILTNNAPGTGSRWDLVWVKQNDPEKGDNDGATTPTQLNTAIIGVAIGVADSAPQRPYNKVPAGAYVLSEHQIFAGTVGTNANPNTSKQLWSYTAARGAVIPVRDKADRDTITAPSPRQSVMRLDRDQHLQTWFAGATPQDPGSWKYTSAPERFYVDPATFVTTANQVSKVVGYIVMPIRAYATKVRVNGRLSVTAGSIASGALQLRVAVSVATSQVGQAQGKSWLVFSAPGSYTETRGAETDWIAVTANQDALPRIWIEHMSGGVNQNARNQSNESHFWAEVLPADD